MANKINVSEFEMRPCTKEDFHHIVNLQKEALMQINSVDLLRKNTDEMLMRCLCDPHYTLGAWHKGVLAGFTILYFPDNDEENLALSLENEEIKDLIVANYKLCIVSKDFVGNSLQYHLGNRIEKYAREKGVNLICATASPKNQYSILNLEKLGYLHNCTLTKYGYKRNLYMKYLK